MTDDEKQYTRSDSERNTSSGQGNEAAEKSTSTGSSPQNEAETSNSSGQKAPAPEIGEAEEAASKESRRIAAAEDTEL